MAIATALMPPLCTAGFGIANGRWDMFAGAFYLYVNCGGLLGKTTAEGQVLNSDSEVVMYLLESQGVAVVAGTAYGLAPFFRMSIATAIATLDQGCARIKAAVAALR